MDDIRIGARFRALRHRLGWRQQDLAARAKVSQGVISLVERGRIEDVTIRKLRRIAREVDAEFTNLLRWRGGDLDRLIDEAHAHLVGRTAELLRAAGWVVRIEVSYSVYGERGSIDLLGWHAVHRVLLTVEVKSELVSIEETVRKHDEKVRLARRIAREQLGWEALAIGRLLVLPALSTARRRVERHESVLAIAYPVRGLDVRHWLRAPGTPLAGLLFVDVDRDGHGNRPKRSRVRISKSDPYNRPMASRGGRAS